MTVIELEVREDAKPLWAHLFKFVSDLVRHAKGDLIPPKSANPEGPKPIEDAEENTDAMMMSFHYLRMPLINHRKTPSPCGS